MKIDKVSPAGFMNYPNEIDKISGAQEESGKLGSLRKAVELSIDSLGSLFKVEFGFEMEYISDEEIIVKVVNKDNGLVMGKHSGEKFLEIAQSVRKLLE